ESIRRTLLARPELLAVADLASDLDQRLLAEVRQEEGI
ncbi:MAG: tRNA (guanosine(37)-N1)-methyltransferase TrmD, partial [Desulfarculus sp.]|nr:tRNA (guanosine(37)-N1)-methyltransferase TrmD [Desulfarculus sp.]